ncbi:MAG: hypothetical protein WDM79_11625 [Terricaulis sp.]
MDNSATKLGVGVALGVGIGTALGVAMDNLAAGISVGIGIGVAMALVWSARRHQTTRRAERTLRRISRMENFKIDVDADGIALVTFDVPGRSMNTITGGVMRDLAALVEQIKGDAAIKGVVITSGKEAAFAPAPILANSISAAARPRRRARKRS